MWYIVMNKVMKSAICCNTITTSRNLIKNFLNKQLQTWRIMSLATTTASYKVFKPCMFIAMVNTTHEIDKMLSHDWQTLLLLMQTNSFCLCFTSIGPSCRLGVTCLAIVDWTIALKFQVVIDCINLFSWITFLLFVYSYFKWSFLPSEFDLL